MTTAPKHRRRPNLTCSFTPAEVRALDDLLTVMLDPTCEFRVPPEAVRKTIENMALKFARMRAKTKGMGL